MKFTMRVVLSILLLAFVSPAFGCTYFEFPPAQKFRMNSIVVLAYPIAISTSPENALSPNFGGEFSQTIQWQVLISWKGPYRQGDVITTMTDHDTSMCGSGAQYKREVMLLHLNGKEPFKSNMPDRPIDSIEELKYLDRVRRGG